MIEKKKYNNKWVWITGASSGIGAELAKQLSLQGAKLILSSRKQSELDKLAQSLSAETLVQTLDLADQASLDKALATVVETIGQVPDVLISNGGVSQRSLAMETEAEVERQLMEINFFGTVYLAKAVQVLMAERGSGQQVFISSVAGKIGSQRRSTYCASKHALLGYVNAMRAENRDSGVQFCVVCPGFVQTQVSVNALTGNGEQFAQHEATIANGMAVEVFAQRMIQGMAKGKDEMVIANGVARFGYWVHKFSPNCYHYLLKKLPDPS